MDLKMLDEVFALRDEALKDELWAPSVDPEALRRIVEGANGADVLRAEQEDLAAKLMMRATELHDAADFSSDEAGRESLAFVSSLLDAATVPLDWAAESLGHHEGPVAVPLAVVEAEHPPITRARQSAQPRRKSADLAKPAKPAKRAKRAKKSKKRSD